MTHIRLIDSARQLPEAWSSSIVAKFGGANLKLVRMDAAAYPQECHHYAEGLLVLDGELLLQIEGKTICVGTGELYIVAAGVPHAVAAGSSGTLLILDI
jgi:quercetin dioxygenase-like cupin family protein